MIDKNEIKKPVLKFTCLRCGNKFDAEQGSRCELCDKCLAERVRAGKKVD